MNNEEQIIKYKEALKEIRSIVREINTKCVYFSYDCDMLKSKIINTINELVDENE